MNDINKKQEIEEKRETEEKQGIKTLLINVAAAKKSKEEEEKDTILVFELERMREVIGTNELKFKVVKNTKFYDMFSEKNKQKRDALLVARALVEPQILTKENREAFNVNSNYELIQALFSEIEISTLANNIILRTENINLRDDIKN